MVFFYLHFYNEPHFNNPHYQKIIQSKVTEVPNQLEIMAKGKKKIYEEGTIK